PVPTRRPRNIHAGTHARQEAGRNTVMIRDLGHGKPPHLCVHLLTTDWATRTGTRLLEYLFGRHASILKPDIPVLANDRPYATIHQVKPSQIGCCTKPSAAPSTTLFAQRAADSICSTDQGR